MAHCSAAVTEESLLCGAPPRAAQCLAAVADESLPRGAGAQSAAHCEIGVFADGRLSRGATAKSAGHCEVRIADGSPPRGADAESRRSSGPVHASDCEASTLRLTTLRKKIEADMLDKTRRALMQLKPDEKWRASSTRWPSHWNDLVHGEDGGYDMFACRVQDGCAVLRQELAKLAVSGGEEWAVDAVSGVSLDPELVKEAREVDMTFSARCRYAPACPERCKR